MSRALPGDHMAPLVGDLVLHLSLNVLPAGFRFLPFLDSFFQVANAFL